MNAILDRHGSMTAASRKRFREAGLPVAVRTDNGAPFASTVNGAGLFRLEEREVLLSNALASEYIGLETVDDGAWSILYHRTLPGRIDERPGEITGAMV